MHIAPGRAKEHWDFSLFSFSSQPFVLLGVIRVLVFCYLFSSLVQVAGHVFLSLPREVRYSPAPFSLATVLWVFSALSLHINCSTYYGVVQLHICSLFFWVPCLLPGYAPCFADFTTWSIFLKVFGRSCVFYVWKCFVEVKGSLEHWSSPSSVLDSVMSTRHKLMSSERGELQLKKRLKACRAFSY